MPQNPFKPKPKPFFDVKPGDKLAEKMEGQHQDKVMAKTLGMAAPEDVERVPDAEEQAAKALGVPYERQSPKVRMREIKEGFDKQYATKQPRRPSPRELAFRGALKTAWLP
jgi:hypothetical protein